jgi:hypothetical protein
MASEASPVSARTGIRLSRDAIEHPLAKSIGAVRSLGIASSIVPARVSWSRARYPLREFTRIAKDREVVAPHHGHTPN